MSVLREDKVAVDRVPGGVLESFENYMRLLHDNALFERMVPVTMADVHLEAGAGVEQELPTDYNGLVYGLAGTVRVGASGRVVRPGQVAWLDRPAGDGASVLRLEGGEEGGRVVLYAGRPTRDGIATHGPFVGDSRADLVRKYEEFRDGEFPRMSEIVKG